MADPRIAPASVRAALRRGIDLYSAGRGGKGLVDDTVDWARALASGAKITYPKAVKMRGWFARHGPAENEGARRLRDSQSPAAVAWLLWGGDPAIPYRARGWDDPVNAWVRGAIAFYEDNPTVDPGSIEPPRAVRRNVAGRAVRVSPKALPVRRGSIDPPRASRRNGPGGVVLPPGLSLRPDGDSFRCDDCGAWEHLGPARFLRHSRRCDTPRLQPVQPSARPTVAPQQVMAGGFSREAVRAAARRGELSSVARSEEEVDAMIAAGVISVSDAMNRDY